MWCALCALGFGECCGYMPIISGPGGHPQTRKSSSSPQTHPARRPWARTSAAHNVQAFFPLLCLRLTSARPAYSCQTLWSPTYLNSQKAAQWILGAAGGETDPSLPGRQYNTVSDSLDSKGAWRAAFPQRAASAGRPGSEMALVKDSFLIYTRIQTCHKQVWLPNRFRHDGSPVPGIPSLPLGWHWVPRWHWG